MFNYSTAINVYDSLGNKQQLMAYFAKVADAPAPAVPVHPTVAGGTDWQMYVTDVNGNMVGGAPATLASTTRARCSRPRPTPSP